MNALPNIGPIMPNLVLLNWLQFRLVLRLWFKQNLWFVVDDDLKECGLTTSEVKTKFKEKRRRRFNKQTYFTQTILKRKQKNAWSTEFDNWKISIFFGGLVLVRLSAFSNKSIALLKNWNYVVILTKEFLCSFNYKYFWQKLWFDFLKLYFCLFFLTISQENCFGNVIWTSKTQQHFLKLLYSAENIQFIKYLKGTILTIKSVPNILLSILKIKTLLT